MDSFTRYSIFLEITAASIRSIFIAVTNLSISQLFKYFVIVVPGILLLKQSSYIWLNVNVRIMQYHGVLFKPCRVNATCNNEPYHQYSRLRNTGAPLCICDKKDGLHWFLQFNT